VQVQAPNKKIVPYKFSKIISNRYRSPPDKAGVVYERGGHVGRPILTVKQFCLDSCSVRRSVGIDPWEYHTRFTSIQTAFVQPMSHEVEVGVRDQFVSRFEIDLCEKPDTLVSKRIKPASGMWRNSASVGHDATRQKESVGCNDLTLVVAQVVNSPQR